MHLNILVDSVIACQCGVRLFIVGLELSLCSTPVTGYCAYVEFPFILGVATHPHMSRFSRGL